MVDSPTLQRHSRRRRDLIRVLHGELARLLPAVTSADPTAFTQMATPVISQYGQAAAVLGAEFYDTLRADTGALGGFTVPLADPPPPEQVAGSLRWATSARSGDDEMPAATRHRVEGAAQRLALQPERDTLTAAAETDDAARGWARVSTDPGGPCGWCAVMISRGPAYRSYRSAGGDTQWHDHDMCVPVPVFGPTWPGADQYDHYERVYRTVTAGYSGRDAVNAMRRHQRAAETPRP